MQRKLKDNLGSIVSWQSAGWFAFGAASFWAVEKVFSLCRQRTRPFDEVDSVRSVGITGAGGVIGTVLRQGLSTYELRNFVLTEEDLEDCVAADLSDARAVQGLFRGLDCVIHLAADSSPHATLDSILKNNIRATYNVLDECVRSGVKKLILASSNHVVSGHLLEDFSSPSAPTIDPNPADIDEKASVFADSLYGVSKATCEDMCRYFSARYGLEVICLRIGWIISPDDPSFTKGKASENYMRAMYLSHEDCIEAFRQSIQIKPRHGFFVANVVSNNDRRVLSIDFGTAKLNFKPKSNSEKFW